MIIVFAGSFTSGFFPIGPFNNEEEATDFMRSININLPFETMVLEHPKSFKEAVGEIPNPIPVPLSIVKD